MQRLCALLDKAARECSLCADDVTRAIDVVSPRSRALRAQLEGIQVRLDSMAMLLASELRSGPDAETTRHVASIGQRLARLGIAAIAAIPSGVAEGAGAFATERALSHFNSSAKTFNKLDACAVVMLRSPDPPARPRPSMDPEPLPLRGARRVHQLAKELGMTNSETLDLALALGIAVSTHASSISEPQADRVRRRAERDHLTRDLQPRE